MNKKTKITKAFDKFVERLNEFGVVVPLFVFIFLPLAAASLGLSYVLAHINLSVLWKP